MSPKTHTSKGVSTVTVNEHDPEFPAVSVAVHVTVVVPSAKTDPDAGQFIVASGGIWMSGCGPTVAGDSIYFVTGNGVFNAASGGTEYGDSMVRLKPALGQIGVADYFTPFNQQEMHDQDIDFGSGGNL